MIDISKLSPEVLKALRGLQFEDEDIAKMESRQVWDEYARYYKIRYSSLLFDVVTEILNAEVKD